MVQRRIQTPLWACLDNLKAKVDQMKAEIEYLKDGMKVRVKRDGCGLLRAF